MCTPGSYFIQDTEESTMKRACQFKRSLLKNCSGLEDQTFGYSRGHPCILLKMNRVWTKLIYDYFLLHSLKCCKCIIILRLRVLDQSRAKFAPVTKLVPLEDYQQAIKMTAISWCLSTPFVCQKILALILQVPFRS